MEKLGPYLVLKNIPQREWSFPIGERRKIVGRSRSAHIVIDKQFRTVSRRHAEIWRDRHGICLRDLGSTCGTKVNGVWIDHAERVAVEIGDTIWLGGAVMEVVDAVDELAFFPPQSTEGLGTNNPTGMAIGSMAVRELSAAEMDVLLWMSRGYESNFDIGKKLKRSPHTVRTQIGSIFKKLHVHSKSELMGWILREGVVALLLRQDSQQPGKALKMHR